MCLVELGTTVAALCCYGYTLTLELIWLQSSHQNDPWFFRLHDFYSVPVSVSSMPEKQNDTSSTSQINESDEGYVAVLEMQIRGAHHVHGLLCQKDVKKPCRLKFGTSRVPVFDRNSELSKMVALVRKFGVPDSFVTCSQATHGITGLGSTVM